MKRFGVGTRVLMGAALVAAAALAAPSAASAVPAGTIGTYPTWNISGTANNFSGTAEFTSPSLASPTVQTTSVTQSVASGATSYLGSNTGFGQEYGTSRSQPYLTLRPTSASPAPNPPSTTTPPPSTTTITFPSPGAAPGWGFALGDVDADWVFVTAYDASGTALDQSALGEQGTGNYCQNASPKPTSCSGVTTFDTPNWTGASTASSFGINWAPGTVYGNGTDTTGAYIWFMPSPDVAKITLLYGALSGSPNFQLWLAQPAPLTTITGTVDIPGAASGEPIPAGTEVQLDNADGTPVESIDDTPVTVVVDPDGSYTIETEQRADYELAVDAPPGYDAPAPITIPALAATETDPPLALAPAPSATPTPTPVPAPSATAAQPALAATGSDAAPWLWCAFALLLAGGVALLGARRSTRHR